MNQQELQLRKDVMRRVRMVYLMRFVSHHEVVKSAVFMTCCIAVIYTVSIPSVVANMSHMPGITDGAAYLFAAFLHTEFMVQALVVAGMGVAGWLAYDLARGVVQPLVFRRLVVSR